MSIKLNFEAVGNREISDFFVSKTLTLKGKREFTFDDLVASDGEISIPTNKIGDYISYIVAYVDSSSTTVVPSAKINFTTTNTEPNLLTGTLFDDLGPATFTAGTFTINGSTVTVNGAAAWGGENLVNAINTAGYTNGFCAYITGEGTNAAAISILQVEGNALIIGNVVGCILSEFGLSIGTTIKESDQVIGISGLLAWDVSSDFSATITGITVSTDSTDPIDVSISLYGE